MIACVMIGPYNPCTCHADTCIVNTPEKHMKYIERKRERREREERERERRERERREREEREKRERERIENVAICYTLLETHSHHLSGYMFLEHTMSQLQPWLT
jgi:hypothetical protein